MIPKDYIIKTGKKNYVVYYEEKYNSKNMRKTKQMYIFKHHPTKKQTKISYTENKELAKRFTKKTATRMARKYKFELQMIERG
jgi:hypothetical protein